MLTGQVLIGLQTILNKDKTAILGHLRIVYDGVGATFLKCSFGILITIEFLAFECEEDTAFGAVAAIRRDARMLLIEFV
jgi:hypothetical protein